MKPRPFLSWQTKIRRFHLLHFSSTTLGQYHLLIDFVKNYFPKGTFKHKLMTDGEKRHGENCMGKTAWGKHHGENCMVKNAWGKLHGENCMGKTAWGKLHGENCMVKTAW